MRPKRLASDLPEASTNGKTTSFRMEGLARVQFLPRTRVFRDIDYAETQLVSLRHCLALVVSLGPPAATFPVLLEKEAITQGQQN